AEADLEELEEWISNGGKVDDYPEEKEEKPEEDEVKESKKNQASSDDKVEGLDVANPINDRKNHKVQLASWRSSKAACYTECCIAGTSTATAGENTAAARANAETAG
ncbi:hypothetical protein BGX27_001933, partial [Mortierella sp. AM989]